mmetsp:Transcript_21014/g.54729  ORF Transcript_21014/g.54729 Transcript_21014/m.54729 type:complete len:206 (-) Transcript_21014:959-1576(-)
MPTRTTKVSMATRPLGKEPDAYIVAMSIAGGIIRASTHAVNDPASDTIKSNCGIPAARAAVKSTRTVRTGMYPHFCHHVRSTSPSCSKSPPLSSSSGRAPTPTAASTTSQAGRNCNGYVRSTESARAQLIPMIQSGRPISSSMNSAVMDSCVCGPNATFESSPTIMSSSSVTVMAAVTIPWYCVFARGPSEFSIGRRMPIEVVTV